jgi:hypothetical protein
MDCLVWGLFGALTINMGYVTYRLLTCRTHK